MPQPPPSPYRVGLAPQGVAFAAMAVAQPTLPRHAFGAETVNCIGGGASTLLTAQARRTASGRAPFLRLRRRDMNAATSQEVFAGPYLTDHKERAKFNAAFIDMTKARTGTCLLLKSVLRAHVEFLVTSETGWVPALQSAAPRAEGAPMHASFAELRRGPAAVALHGRHGFSLRGSLLSCMSPACARLELQGGEKVCALSALQICGVPRIRC